VNTGDVHGAIMGSKVPHYYPFGSAVNIASRMESNSLPGKVHISDSTAHIARRFPEFKIRRRPKMQIKGIGEMQTYFIEKKTEEEQLIQSVESTTSNYSNSNSTTSA
jgi:class 3 adenylate cyclase